MGNSAQKTHESKSTAGSSDQAQRNPGTGSRLNDLGKRAVLPPLHTLCVPRSGPGPGTRKAKSSGAIPIRCTSNTSYAERHDLTLRMQMRRVTRLTSGFSKKFHNPCHAPALYFFWYNWVCSHEAHKLTPAMAAGLASSPREMRGPSYDDGGPRGKAFV